MYAAERHFVTSAHKQLRLLARSEGDAQATLMDIKQKAIPLKARAIYRAALLCEDVLSRSGPDTDTGVNFQTYLARLNSLLGLYATGLCEIDPEFKALQSGQTTSCAPDVFAQPLKAANENAAQVLAPLLHLVREGDPKTALDFLTQYESNAHSVLPTSQAVLPTSQAVLPTTQAQKSPEIRFETMMGRITNRVLSEARLNAKGISISYAADFDGIDASIAKPLQGVIEQICLSIVRTGLVEETQTHTSKKRVWQISVTGEDRGRHNLISVSWPGYKVSELQHGGFDEALSGFQTMGGRINHKVRKKADRDVMHGVDTGLDVQILEIISPLKSQEKIQEKTQEESQEKIQEKIQKKGQGDYFVPAVNM